MFMKQSACCDAELHSTAATTAAHTAAAAATAHTTTHATTTAHAAHDLSPFIYLYEKSHLFTNSL